MYKVGLFIFTLISLCIFFIHGDTLTEEEMNQLINAPFITVNIEGDYERNLNQDRSLKDKLIQAKRMCQCHGITCGCCTKYTIMFVGIKACANITILPKEKAFKVFITVGGKSVYSSKIDAKNLEKVCSTVPKINSVELCLHNTIEEHAANGFTSCMSFDISWKGQLMANINFHCLKYEDNKLSFQENTITGKDAPATLKIRSPLELLAKLIEAGLKKLEE
uniref:Heteropteran venom family 2 protein 3 n=1 Tax=Ectomocoris sp. TaxID=3104572 RepID=A0AB38ZE97_9HEMI